MPPHYKRRRPESRRNDRSKNVRSKQTAPTTAYISSRTRDTIEDQQDSQQSSSESEAEFDVNENLSASSSEEEDQPPRDSYASLLRSLKPAQLSSSRPAKRRKTDSGNTTIERNVDANVSDTAKSLDAAEEDNVEEVIEEPAEAEVEAIEDLDSEDETVLQSDPYETHFATITEDDLSKLLQKVAGKGANEKSKPAPDVRKVKTFHSQTSRRVDQGSTHLKKKIADAGVNLRKSLTLQEQDLFEEVFHYVDILYACRTVETAQRLRDIAALHSLNHLFKTRDRVLKNTAKLSQDTSNQLDLRDQGFTRPKILYLLPTKQACVRHIDSIVKLSEPDQQENKSRFLDTFSLQDDDTFDNKPEDFRDLFGGNHEEDFRVGLKFTRKTIKFFSGFYNSDIIFASPLGLMRTISTGGGKKDSQKGHDADFLSSIEVVVMDHANALEMQNWQHVDYVFSHLNLLPKDSHGCDFNRVRHWYLDGKAKNLRQTIVFTDYITPAISSLATNYLHNISGLSKYTPIHPGKILHVPPSLPFPLTQTFLRFDSPDPQTDTDTRFAFFTATILPSLLRSSNKPLNKGTLIFIPSYLDFLRLRNHFSTAAETTSLAYGTVSEYSSKGDVARARSHFMSGKHSVLLYSERAHHYFRYKLRGVRRVLFYGVPENPVFWSEMLEMVAANAAHEKEAEWVAAQRGKQGKGLVRALFSKWDFLKVERIVGTERVGRLMGEKEGDVFEFV